MEERSVAHGIVASVLSGLFEFAEPLRWLMLMGVALIIVDMRFGIQASRVRGENIRLSRAIRRTINKSIDYLCWVLLSGSIGATFGESMGVSILPALVMIVIYGVEINSCFSNYFESRGRNVKVDIFQYLARKGDILKLEDMDSPKRKQE